MLAFAACTNPASLIMGLFAILQFLASHHLATFEEAFYIVFFKV